MTARFTNPKPQFLFSDGKPITDGQLFIYENNTTTFKDTYADANLTVLNPNPLPLEGDGRVPNCFYAGTATIVLVSASQGEIWQVDAAGQLGDGSSFDIWNSVIEYGIDAIVTASNGEDYRSLQNNNIGNDPISSPDFWERIEFVREWNPNVTYNVPDIAKGSDGFLYRSITNGNLNNDPAGGLDPTNWGSPLFGGSNQNLETTDDVTFNSLTLAVPLAILNGGTGATAAPDARTNLGLGTGDSPTFAGLTLSGPLEAQSTVRLQNNQALQIRNLADTVWLNAVSATGTNSLTFGSEDSAGLEYRAVNFHRFFLGGTEFMRLNASGALEINNIAARTGDTVAVDDNLTVNGAASFAGNATIDTNTPQLVLDGDASGDNALLNYSRNGSQRWGVRMDNSSESGGNVGSDYNIDYYTDAGGFGGTAFRIQRDSGIVQLLQGAQTNTIAAVSGGAVTVNDQAVFTDTSGPLVQFPNPFLTLQHTGASNPRSVTWGIDADSALYVLDGSDLRLDLRFDGEMRVNTLAAVSGSTVTVNDDVMVNGGLQAQAGTTGVDPIGGTTPTADMGIFIDNSPIGNVNGRIGAGIVFGGSNTGRARAAILPVQGPNPNQVGMDFYVRSSTTTSNSAMSLAMTLDYLGRLVLPSIPTSNPGGSGIVWNDGGTLKIT